MEDSKKVVDLSTWKLKKQLADINIYDAPMNEQSFESGELKPNENSISTAASDPSTVFDRS